ncbi:MAG: hypothetical protein CMI63_10575 [Parvularcula sp.]|nr:hypothetical protein [Parvularcula sp.]
MPERKILRLIYLVLGIVAVAALAAALMISSDGLSRLLSIISGAALLSALLIRVAMIADVARNSFKKQADREA